MSRESHGRKLAVERVLGAPESGIAMQNTEAITQPVAVLLAVIVGWCLSLCTSVFQYRREKKKCTGRILYILLRIRRDFILASLKADYARVLMRPSQDFMAGFGAAIGLSTTDREDLPTELVSLSKEYSSLDPLGAYRIQLYSLWLPSLAAIHQKLTQMGLKLEDLPSGSSKLVPMRTMLDGAIRAVAWRHSAATWARVRRHLSRNIEAEIKKLAAEHPELTAAGTSVEPPTGSCTT